MRGAYAELLLVLTLVWTCLVAYGFLDRELTLGSLTLEKAPVRELLGIGAAAPSPEGIAPAHRDMIGPAAEFPARATAASPSPPPSENQPHTTEKILLFGDSMVEVVQPRLADYCLENGHELVPVIAYASTTTSWATSAELGTLLERVEPTMVIVALGSSELGARDLGLREKSVRRIASRVGARKLLWIGPPNWRDDTGINAVLERVLGKGRFFRSAELELERKADGIHPNATGGRTWIEAFVRWVDTESAYRPALVRPTRTAPKIPARLFGQGELL